METCRTFPEMSFASELFEPHLPEQFVWDHVLKAQ